jgi:hypothetical protein
MPRKRGVCVLEGCGRPHASQGYCDLHYRRKLAKGTTDAPPPRMKATYPDGRLVQDSGLYKRWGAARNGRGFPLIPEWEEDFWAFYAGVGDRPEHYRLYPINRSKPLGPGNFSWQEPVLLKRQAGETELEYRRRYYQARKDLHGTSQLDSQLRKKFGADFGLEEYRAMLKAQDGKCAICGKDEIAKGRYGSVKMPAVDHDHNTGKPRAFLCQNCNHMLGCVKDDRAILLAGVAYLDKHGSKAYPS